MQHIIFGLTMAISLLLSRVSKVKKQVVCLIPFFILWLFAAIRYGYGNDYFSYYNAFYAVKTGAYSFGTEILFEFLLRLFPVFYLFIAFSALFTIYPVGKMVSESVDIQYIPIAVLIYWLNPYLFITSLSAIRQWVAVSLFIVAVYFAYKKRLLFYFVTVIAASMIHTSALILFPVYFWANDKKPSRKLLYVLMLIVAGLLLSGEIFLGIVKYILDWIGKVNYVSYLNSGSGSSIRSVMLSALFLIYLMCNIRKLDGWQLTCGKVYMIGAIIGVLVLHVNMMGRIQFYFDIFMVIVIPAIMKANSRQKNTVWGIINKYLFPALLFGVLLGRYINFFNAPYFAPFKQYRTILEVL